MHHRFSKRRRSLGQAAGGMEGGMADHAWMLEQLS